MKNISIIVMLAIGATSFLVLVLHEITIREINKRLETIECPPKLAEFNPTGYFLDKDKKVMAEKVDESLNDIKVKFWGIGWMGMSHIYHKWLPKKDFYKIYNNEELSEIVRKLQKILERL
jgi:hypothetical protein